MRNPLKRQPGAAPRKPLRERLDEAKARLIGTKVRAGKALAVARVVMQPDPKPVPAVERIALINYATFLDIERRAVCQELYPHAGPEAFRFVHMNVAADSAHLSRAGVKPAPASSRALAVLDMAGIDWRRDREGSVWSRPGEIVDTEGAPYPHGWPYADAALSEALDDLSRLDAAQEAMHDAALDESRDIYETPGYAELDLARDAALERLASTPAESLVGLQAKARALQTPSVRGTIGPAENIAESLARDLIGAHPTKIEPQPDPILAIIDEARRLMVEHGRCFDISGHRPDSDPSHDATADASDAMWEHVRGILLNTVPRTAQGCKALARFSVDFSANQGVPLAADSNDPVLGLIARSPLL